MSEPLAYLNGRFVPQSQCMLPIYDAGIVLGAAVTDLLRTFGGRPYAVDRHIERFFASARYAYLPLAVSPTELRDIVDRLVDHNLNVWDGHELALILYATAGEFSVYAGSAASPTSPSTLVAHCFPLPLRLWRDHVSSGVHVVTPAQRHIPPNTLSSKIKHRNRLHMWIGDQQAKLVDPKAVGLYLDIHGNITETGGSNFVIYQQGTVISPQRPNILWGITLDDLERLCPPLGLSFVERDIQIHDVVNAEEAWLVTTPYFLAPAVKINGITIGAGGPGPVWRKLMDAFQAEVGVDIVQQILEDVVEGVE